jgi:hypothetical protein
MFVTGTPNYLNNKRCEQKLQGDAEPMHFEFHHENELTHLLNRFTNNLLVNRLSNLLVINNLQRRFP